MRTVLTLAAGIWIAREIFTTRAANAAREKEVRLRKRLESFLQENFSDQSPQQQKRTISKLLKGL